MYNGLSVEEFNQTIRPSEGGSRRLSTKTISIGVTNGLV